MPTLKHDFHYFGPYLAEMKADPEYCAKLLKLGKTLKKSNRHNLVGQIQDEYSYPLETENWIFEGFKIYLDTWLEGYRWFNDTPEFNPKYNLETMWINKMKAKEYNPVHTHTYCDLSFVLWLETPQEILDEAEKNETSAPNPGQTSFIYGEDRPLHVTEKHITPVEHTLLMFPASLRHYVMHFNSDVNRTSVSGNVTLEYLMNNELGRG